MVPNLNSEDYYKILGIPRSADESVLKKAYRKLAVKVNFRIVLLFFWRKKKACVFKYEVLSSVPVRLCGRAR